MRLTNAELLTLRAVENRKLVQKAYDSGHTQSCDEEKIDSENRLPGDFYCMRTGSRPRWAARSHCAEAYAGNEDITGRKSAR